MSKCEYCGTEEYSGKSFGTHIINCSKNPKYKEIKEKRSTSLRKNIFKNYIVKCYKCGIDFNVTEPESKFPIKERYFCSRKCANSRIFSEETRNKMGESSRNKNSHKPLYCKFCKNEILSYSRKVFCSDTCNLEYRVFSNIKRSYRHKCGFRFEISKYPEEFDNSLIDKFGLYKPTNSKTPNLSGISRDHMLSVFDGESLNISYRIISHPANCKLIQHAENSRKNKNSSITILELCNKILNWNLKYKDTDEETLKEVNNLLNDI